MIFGSKRGSGGVSMSDPNRGSASHIAVHYQKSQFFRVIHADGCYGGMTPRGKFQMAFFSERPALPRGSNLEVADGAPRAEQITETRGGLVRELEVDAIMDFDTAVSLMVWLRDRLGQARRDLGVSDEEWARTTGMTRD
jgi:hypothetical protein